MPKGHKNITITVKLDERIKTLLEKCSHETGLSLSQYVRNIIYSALEDYRILSDLKRINLDLFNISTKADTSRIKIEEPGPSKEVNISVIIREDVKAKLEKISTDLGLTLKQVARNFIYVGLYEHDVLRKLGMVQIGKIANGFLASINKVFMPHKK
ncbi:MAG: DUF6290 family protein [Desulfobulbaceae bacterium]|nr:DUF6290 family protein [Desulfobulbaceae bacterium]